VVSRTVIKPPAILLVGVNQSEGLFHGQNTTINWRPKSTSL